MPVRIIINADDLGANVAINDAVFGMMDRGVVTSATIIANAPGVADALERLPKYPACSFGVHLNAMQYRPLTNPAAFQPLLDTDGALTAKLEYAPISTDVRRAIFDEWCAQVQLLKDQGVRVSHLDSHYHMHHRPELFFVLKAVQRRFGIRRVRVTKNLYSKSCPPASKVLPLKKRLWNFGLKKYYATSTTDFFTEFATFMEAAHDVSWSDQTVELMVHPGGTSYDDETAQLQKFRVSELPFEAKLISYDEL